MIAKQRIRYSFPRGVKIYIALELICEKEYLKFDFLKNTLFTKV